MYLHFQVTDLFPKKASLFSQFLSACLESGLMGCLSIMQWTRVPSLSRQPYHPEALAGPGDSFLISTVLCQVDIKIYHLFPPQFWCFFCFMSANLTNTLTERGIEQERDYLAYSSRLQSVVWGTQASHTTPTAKSRETINASLHACRLCSASSSFFILTHLSVQSREWCH